MSFMWIIWNMYCEKVCVCSTHILKQLNGARENALSPSLTETLCDVNQSRFRECIVNKA